MLTGGAFTALLLLTVVAVVAVPPPANVTLRCENQKVTASWDDEHQQPGSRYKVSIYRSGGLDNEIETSDPHYDLSQHIWSSEDRYMDSFYVDVRVLLGGNQSDPVVSKTLSFSHLRTVSIKCALDFPPVEVTLSGSTVSVTVKNPSLIYKELKTSGDPQFKYILRVNGTTVQESHDKWCQAKEPLCRTDINIVEGEETCFLLNGFWFTESGVEQLKFKDYGPVCPTGDNVLMVGLIMMAIVLIIPVMVTLICMARAWAMKVPDLPKALNPNPKNQTVMYDTLPAEEVSIVEPSGSLLVTSKDEGPYENLQSSGASSGSSAPDRFPYLEKHLSDSSNQEQVSEGNRTDGDSADDSVMTEVLSVESEGEETELKSPYDCPHMRVDLCVDMGNGEFATGYTGE